MKAINWNQVPNALDKTVWDRLTTNFWLPEKIAVSNDLDSWSKLSEAERDTIKKVFVSLTMLDTLQAEYGAPSLIEEISDNQHGVAVLSNIQFMECVHAKSYSTIFSTLCSSEEIDELFSWAEYDNKLQCQAETIIDHYLQCDESGMRFAASVFLESVLFYTGFFAPLKLAAEGKLTNTADIIRLIMRDEGVHGFYIGATAQRLDLVQPLKDDILGLLQELLEVEYRRCEQLYDEVGWTEEVKAFLRYNANKALANLGMGPLFPAHETQIPPYILAALDIGTVESHDFFSGNGASYIMGKAEETTQEDWEW